MREDVRLTDEARKLDRYLIGYRTALKRKRQLAARREEIRREFEHPLKGMRYDGMPRGGTGSSDGAAALTYRLDDITQQIMRAEKNAVHRLREVMRMLGHIPEDAPEKAILEHRYIDGYGWREICTTEHIEKTAAVRRWRKGLYMILDKEKERKARHGSGAEPGGNGGS